MSLISLTISTCQRFPFFDILRLDEPCGVRPRRLLGQSRLRHSTEADDACGLRRECHTPEPRLGALRSGMQEQSSFRGC